jgi:hypothetical protein
MGRRRRGASVTLVARASFQGRTSGEVEETRRKCKLCSKPILILRDSDGELMPLDLETPTFVVERNWLDGSATASPAPALALHAFVCPQAEDRLREKARSKYSAWIPRRGG